MKPNKKTYSYIYLMFFIAILFLVYLFSNFKPPALQVVLFWSFMSIVSESLPIILPNNNMAVSVGSAINFSAIIVGGPLLGAIAYPIGLLFRFPYVAHKKTYSHILNTPYYMTMFNVSQGIIVSSIMGLSYVYSGGKIGGFYPLQSAFIILIGTFINTITISILITFLEGKNFMKIWMDNIRGVLGGALAVGTIGLIIAISFMSYGYWAVLLFFGPLLLARQSFKLYVDMRNVNINIIQTLSKMLEAKDSYTSGHSSRVEEYAVKLATAHGMSDKKIENIRTAAILHDIGKIGIKDTILNKEDKLTPDEFDEIMSHPVVGANIISKIDIFKEVTPIVRYHHEKYDGSGYPEGLKGAEIPIEACILSIADSFDAITSDRPYRDGLEREIAFVEIEKSIGSHFHPKLAKLFISIMSEEGEI